MRRSSRWSLRAVEVAAVVVLAGAAAGLLLRGCEYHRPFDPALWRNPAGDLRDGEPVRYTMLGDLRGRHLRPGTAKQRVLELLGRPDRSAILNGRVVHTYVLGHVQRWWWPMSGIDETVLDLRYDRSGRLVGIWVHET